ncbi:hypothetical protein WMF30_08070 [Sorangium sp. So ce134]
MNMQLFLAHADDHRPVLEDGLHRRAVYDAPRPDFDPPEPSDLLNRSGPADSLREQRWGVIAPKGPAGDRLLQLIKPLQQKREEEQGVPAVVYRIDPGLRFSAANDWIQRDYWNAVGRRARDLPRYLLVLGDADLVSWDLQQMLGSEAYIGRLAFADDSGYEAYVEKVLRHEAEAPAEGVRALFFSVRDGTRATVEGYRYLVAPSLDLAREGARSGWLPTAEIRDIGGGDGMFTDEELVSHAQELLRVAESARAGFLLSLSHGAGAPRQGWGAAEKQRALQGAMVLGRSGDLLTARDVAARPFLPGGLWFLFACFGAGTPARSAYYPWLDRLHRLRRAGPAEHVLASLPEAGGPGFVAALPQAALANPAGPLGVIGHVDLAWTWSFFDYHDPSDGITARRRTERFHGLLRSLADGHRLGVAHGEVSHFFCSLSTELATMYDEDVDLGATACADEAREAARAGLWMQRQDLSAYVLLGDPAARLPIARRPEGVLAQRPPAVDFDVVLPARGAAAPARDPHWREAAVLAVLRGGDERAIAARHGIQAVELRRWVGAFLEAGRATLRILG